MTNPQFLRLLGILFFILAAIINLNMDEDSHWLKYMAFSVAIGAGINMFLFSICP